MADVHPCPKCGQHPADWTCEMWPYPTTQIDGSS